MTGKKAREIQGFLGKNRGKRNRKKKNKKKFKKLKKPIAMQLKKEYNAEDVCKKG